MGKHGAHCLEIFLLSQLVHNNKNKKQNLLVFRRQKKTCMNVCKRQGTWVAHQMEVPCCGECDIRTFGLTGALRAASPMGAKTTSSSASCGLCQCLTAHLKPSRTSTRPTAFVEVKWLVHSACMAIVCSQCLIILLMRPGHVLIFT